jgi:hypothetical protein
MKPDTKGFINHLRSIGYTVQKRENDILVKSDKKTPFAIFPSKEREMLIVGVFIPINEERVLINKETVLEIINDINLLTFISRVATRKDVLVLSSTYIGPYNKELFNEFLKYLEADIKIASQKKLVNIIGIEAK